MPEQTAKTQIRLLEEQVLIGLPFRLHILGAFRNAVRPGWLLESKDANSNIWGIRKKSTFMVP